MKLSIAFSPCPNDTFIFDALVNGHIDTDGLEFDYELDDVEGLNQKATRGQFDITKISYGALPKLFPNYQVLDSGSALGRGVGPLLVSTKQPEFSSSQDYEHSLDGTNNNYQVALPGENTTAHRLFSLAFPNFQNKLFVRFNEIEDLVIQGKVAAGVLIHENRFTYAQKGLIKWMDLGEHWEQKTGAPIPLGGIVIKSSLSQEVKQRVNNLIRKSIEWAFEQYVKNNQPLSPFIIKNAQEMDPTVMRQHIDLYVNEYSITLGEVGRKAIRILLDVASSSTEKYNSTGAIISDRRASSDDLSRDPLFV
jgi:1,4-dihydroxy-6-naphthoate synthase